jgi:hypothetical protein
MPAASANLNANWPIVAGLGVAAAVLVYALYIVNEQLQQADNLIGGAGTDVQSVVSPIVNAFNYLGNLFSSDNQ